MWGSVKALARAYEYLMGHMIFIPVALLAWFPFVSEFQTRLLFNQAFSRGLQIRRILAGGKKNKWVCHREDSESFCSRSWVFLKVPNQSRDTVNVCKCHYNNTSYMNTYLSQMMLLLCRNTLINPLYNDMSPDFSRFLEVLKIGCMSCQFFVAFYHTTCIVIFTLGSSHACHIQMSVAVNKARHSIYIKSSHPTSRSHLRLPLQI